MVEVEEIDVRVEERGGDANVWMRPEKGHAQVQIGRVVVGDVVRVLEQEELVGGAVFARIRA